ncbi:MAG: response regulator transcription factor [Vicingaceae bacterium]
MKEDKSIKILLAEDDKNLGSLLCEFLNSRDYETDLATDGEEGFKKFKEGAYELCLLDVMMPLKDGFTLAREIRQVNPQIPIIFLTAKSMKEDTIEGFKSGADDYITKPFSMEELLFRIKALLRRSYQLEGDSEISSFNIGTYTFDANSQQLEKDGEITKLTSKENQLLKTLCLNRNQVLERETALKLIWGDDTYFNARSMDVYISKLRKYFKSDDSVEIINIHGKGFKLLERTV